MIGEKLAGAYAAAEDKYYDLLDFLDNKGVPVYAYNDFLEDKGIPSFPFTVAVLFLLMVALFAFFAFGTAVNPVVSFSIENQYNDPVSGVIVVVTDQSGRELKTKTVGDGEDIQLQGIGVGSILEVKATKDGYKDGDARFQVTGVKGNNVNLRMERIIRSINASLTLVDSATSDPIANAHVLATWHDISLDEYSNGVGLVPLNGIPESEEINFRIESDAYETITENYSFSEGENYTVNLSPKSAALLGKSQLQVSVQDEEGSLIQGAEIVIRRREDDSIIFQEVTESGEHVFAIEKGTSIRLTVKKDGFLRYDSVVLEESRTMRQDEEEWLVYLERGGETLTVLTYAGGSIPLKDVEVMLFNSENKFLDSEITGLGGTVEFNDLNGETYFVTGWKDGFLPVRKLVDVAEDDSIALVLENADMSNSVFLAVYVTDSALAAANNATLTFWEKQGDKLLPLGIPPKKTDLSGYASVKVGLDISIKVDARKDLEEGSGEKEIEAGKLNEIMIQLQRSVNIVKLSVYDKDGNPAEGHIKITAPNGDLLFEGELTDGNVFFDPMGNERVNVEITTPDGETYSEQINVKDKDEVSLTLGKGVDSIYPTVVFEGIYNSSDEKVEGISKGEYYWLKFELGFAEEMPEGGLHVRLGKDDVAFVDSQEYGIVGYDAVAADYEFGQSYQPEPLPGNESADLQNTGRAGEMNKWIELYFDKLGSKVVAKVKVKAEPILLEKKIELHYRAWGKLEDSFYRTPQDEDLGEALYSDNRTKLYAETVVEEIDVFETEELVCEENLCASYRFVDIQGAYIEPDDFSAVVDNTYALEIDLRAKEDMVATLKVDTSKTMPLLYFTGHEIDSFDNMPSAQEIAEPLPAETDLSGQGYIEGLPVGIDVSEENPYGFAENENKNTSVTVPEINMLAGQERRIRVYFTAATEGQATIATQAIAGEAVVNRDFLFDISDAKELLLSVMPEEIAAGEDFTVSVKDSESNEGIANAVLHLKDSEGAIVRSITGNDSEGKGLGGNYFYENGFDPGTYKLEVMAEGYAPAELEIGIARDGLLDIKSEIKIVIAEGENKGDASATIRNRSEFTINGIAYELEEPENFPTEFFVTVDVPDSLGEGQDSRLTVYVELDLDDESSDSLHGELDLIIKGTAADNFPTTATTKVIIDYNKKLDADCLRFDKRGIALKLIGRADSKATEELEIENTCGEDVTLTAKVESKSRDPNLTLEVGHVTIKNKEIEQVEFTATNSIERRYALQQQFKFEVTFEASNVAKSIPAVVELWNPSFSLSFPPNLPLWLARAPQAQVAKASGALAIRNTGRVPITSFTMAMEDETYRQYPQLRVDLEPKTLDKANLGPGQSLTPARYVHAEFPGEEPFNKPATGYVSFHGYVMGKRYTLGKTSVPINYGGYNCLLLTSDVPMNFASKTTYGTQFKEVKLTNNCAEPVRVRTVEPRNVQGNTLSLIPSDIQIAPNQSQTARMQLAVAKETRFKTLKVKAVGLLINSQQFVESQPLEVSIEIGETALTDAGKASIEKDIKICDAEGRPTNETKKISFPKLSEDCTQGYCDAKQLAEFFAKEVNSKIQMAKQKIKQAENHAKNLPGCSDKEYCTFESMGINLQPIAVFQQLDHLTPAALQHEIETGSYSELGSFSRFEQGSKGGIDGQNVAELTGFDFGAIYLGDEFKGCGKYFVKIDGAVQVENNEILDEGANFVINVGQVSGGEEGESGLVLTPECENKIQNVPNFLPLDEDYSSDETYETWLGLVWYEDEKLESAAEEFAERLFSTSQGRIVMQRQNNNLQIVMGDVEGGLLKVSIEGAGSNTEPKITTVNMLSGSEEDFDKIAKEAAEAVSALKSGTIKGCIDPNDPPLYFVIQDVEFTEQIYGKLEIDSAESKIKVNATEQCIDFNVSRKIEDEVKFRTNFIENLEGRARVGIQAVRVRNSKGEVLRQELVNGIADVDRSITLTADEDAESYTAQLKFCVEGDALFAKVRENLTGISIWATSTNTDIPNPETEPPLELALEVCGIHPYDLFKELGNKKPGTYYATLGWAGPPETLKLTNVINALNGKDGIEGANGAIVTSKSGGTNISDQEPWKKYMLSSRLWGIGSWAIGCAAGEAALAGILAIPSIGISAGAYLLNVAADCGAPAIWMGLKELGYTDPIIKGIGNFFTTIWDWMRGDYKPIEEGESSGETPSVSATQSKLDQSYEELKAQQNEWISESAGGYLQAGAVTSGLRVAIMSGKAAIPAGQAIRTGLGARSIANSAADYLAEESAKRMLSVGKTRNFVTWRTANKKAYDGLVKELRDVYQERLGTRFADAVRNTKGGMTVDDLLKTPLNNGLADASEDLVSKGILQRMRSSGLILDSDLARLASNGANSNLGKVNNGFSNQFHENIANAAGQGVPPQTNFAVDQFNGGVINGSKVVGDYTKELARNTTNQIRSQMGATKFSEMLTEMGHTEDSFRTALRGKMRPRVNTAISNSLADPANLERIPWQYADPVTGKVVTTQRQVYKGASLQSDDAARIVRETMQELETHGLRGVKMGAKQASNQLDDIVKEGIERYAREGGEAAGKKLSPGRLKSMLKGIFSLKFLGSVFKGFGFAAAGQTGGAIGSRVYWEGIFEDAMLNPEVNKLDVTAGTKGDGKDDDGDGQIDEESCDGRDDDGDGVVDEDCRGIIERDLLNGHTYRIDVVEEGNKIGWKLNKIEGEGKFGSAEMEKLLQSKEATLIEGDCTGKFAETKLKSGVFGPYDIKGLESAKTIGVVRAEFYLKNAETIINVLKGKDNVSLAGLLAAMFESKTHENENFEHELKAVAEELSTDGLDGFAASHNLNVDKLRRVAKDWSELPRLKLEVEE